MSVAKSGGPTDGVLSAYSGHERHAVLRTRRDTGPPERRIQYLEFAQRILDRCGAAATGDFKREAHALRQSIEAEARSIRQGLAIPLAAGGRGFAIIYAWDDPSRIDWSQRNAACGGPECAQIRADKIQIPGAGPSAIRPLRLVCRDPAQCDLDRRYTDGKTALYQYVEAADVERVGMLLAARADPNVEREPGGPSGIDALISFPFATRPERIEPALRTVQTLVADGRASISAETAERLRRDQPEVLPGIDSALREKYIEMLKLAASLPSRKRAEAICGPVPKPGRIWMIGDD